MIDTAMHHTDPSSEWACGPTAGYAFCTQPLAACSFRVCLSHRVPRPWTHLFLGQPTKNDWSKKMFTGLVILTQLRRALESYSSSRVYAWLTETSSDQYHKLTSFSLSLINILHLKLCLSVCFQDPKTNSMVIVSTEIQSIYLMKVPFYF